MIPGKYCVLAVEFFAAVLENLQDLAYGPKTAIRNFMCGKKWARGHASLPALQSLVKITVV